MSYVAGVAFAHEQQAGSPRSLTPGRVMELAISNPGIPPRCIWDWDAASAFARGYNEAWEWEAPLTDEELRDLRADLLEHGVIWYMRQNERQVSEYLREQKIQVHVEYYEANHIRVTLTQ